MVILQAANLALRFLLELCLLGALGYWGFRTGSGWALKLLLGLGAPLLAALIWGMFIAPAASQRAPEAVRLILELVLFGLGAAALAHAGQPTLAGVFAVVAGLNIILLRVWRQ